MAALWQRLVSTLAAARKKKGFRPGLDSARHPRAGDGQMWNNQPTSNV
jgi:hypothetical protein